MDGGNLPLPPPKGDKGKWATNKDKTSVSEDEINFFLYKK